jgi:predicted TIM-barrel fold metal-dependent hydrolase
VFIADSQIHLWGPSTPERPWPAPAPGTPPPHKPFPFTAEYLLGEMDRAGVSRAVLISPVYEGLRNDLVLEAAKQHPKRFGVMARFNPLAEDGRDFLPTWYAHPGLLGIRFVFHLPAWRPMFVENKLDWLWAQAERLGKPVMMMVNYWDMHHVAAIAEKHPKLKITLDHMGMTEGRDAATFRDFDQMIALAKYPNISVKASCLPFHSSEPYPFPTLHPYVRRVYEAFGARRMFWGSDLSRLPCPYAQMISMFTEEMQWIAPGDLEWIMGRALCEWLGWPI